MAEFELRDTDAGELGHERVFRRGVGRNLGRYPAITVAEEREEEGAALVHLFEAEADGLLIPRFVLGDAPAQVDVVELDAVGQEPLAERGESHLDQMIALRVHVFERGRQKDADASPTRHR